MNDAFGHPQSVVVLGGTSEIARHVVDLLSPRCRSVVLAGRDPAALDSAAAAVRTGVTQVETVQFDAGDPANADKTVLRCFEVAGEPVDLVLMAVGELGDQSGDEADADRVSQMLTVNLTWPATALAAVALQLKRQGHGRIVVLSSVAGYRVRRSNFIYGSAKAGLDGFAVGLSEAMRGTGVDVHIVRPGFVHTKMTAGLSPAPFAVGPDVVASDIVRGVQQGQTVIWSPRALRWMFNALRLLPQSLWRRLPG